MRPPLLVCLSIGLSVADAFNVSAAASANAATRGSIGVRATSSGNAPTLPVVQGAASEPNGVGPVEYPAYAVVDKVVTNNYVDKNKKLGSCTAGSNGVVCSIDQSVGVSSSVDVAFGLSTSVVSGQLTTSWTSERTVQVGCQSPALKEGQLFTAYAEGTLFTYKLVEYFLPYGKPSEPSSTSGTLTAFEADSGAVYCEVS